MSKLIAALIVIALALLMSGPAFAQKRIQVENGSKIEIEGLKDCTYYEFVPAGIVRPNLVAVVRCPNSAVSTTWTYGKGSVGNATVVEKDTKPAVNALVDKYGPEAKELLENAVKEQLRSYLGTKK